jgi:hypothetical protein
LKQALERGATDEEIDKLMRELREAMNDYLREFAERPKESEHVAGHAAKWQGAAPERP